MRIGTIIAVVLMVAVMPAIVMAQTTAPGSPITKFRDHTNAPIYTVDDVNITWAPVPGMGRNSSVLPPLPSDVGVVYSNINGPFAAFAPALFMGADDYDTTKAGPTVSNHDGFRFVGGVAIAYDVMFFDYYDQNTTGGIGNFVDYWGIQLPYGGNFLWTITGLGLTTPIPDKGWLVASGLAVVDTGFGQWFLDAGPPSVGTNDPTQGGASGGALLHNFELINVIDPGNDACADAQDTGAMPSATAGFNFLATTDGSKCLAGAQQGNVWFTVVGDGNTITASLCNDNIKGLTVYDAAMTLHCNICEQPRCLGFNDDACGRFGYSPQISWCSAPGEVYTIGIGSNFGDFGDFNLEITSDGSACSTADLCISCGDGVVEGDEECDDGNKVNKDGCDEFCKLECGNGFRNPLEECDDGNRDDGDGCDSLCRFEGNVPTISQWGMLVLGSLLLVGLTVKFRRRSVTA